MYRYSFRFVVMSLTILTANLITSTISNYMVSYKNHYKPLVFTFIGMAITVMIFYPLFAKLESWVKDLSVKFVKKGKSVAGKSLGLFVTFIVGLLILTYFYAKIWYRIDLLQIILHGNIGFYI